jgi:hypothetical protein
MATARARARRAYVLSAVWQAPRLWTAPLPTLRATHTLKSSP